MMYGSEELDHKVVIWKNVGVKAKSLKTASFRERILIYFEAESPMLHILQTNIGKSSYRLCRIRKLCGYSPPVAWSQRHDYELQDIIEKGCVNG